MPDLPALHSLPCQFIVQSCLCLFTAFCSVCLCSVFTLFFCLSQLPFPFSVLIDFWYSDLGPIYDYSLDSPTCDFEHLTTVYDPCLNIGHCFWDSFDITVCWHLNSNCLNTLSSNKKPIERTFMVLIWFLPCCLTMPSQKHFSSPVWPMTKNR